MWQGSIKTFLVEIKGCKVIQLRSNWRSNNIRLYCNVPGRFLEEIKWCKAILLRS